MLELYEMENTFLWYVMLFYSISHTCAPNYTLFDSDGQVLSAFHLQRDLQYF